MLRLKASSISINVFQITFSLTAGCSDLSGGAIIFLDLYVRMRARNRYTKPYERKQRIR